MRDEGRTPGQQTTTYGAVNITGKHTQREEANKLRGVPDAYSTMPASLRDRCGLARPLRSLPQNLGLLPFHPVRP